MRPTGYSYWSVFKVHHDFDVIFLMIDLEAALCLAGMHWRRLRRHPPTPHPHPEFAEGLIKKKKKKGEWGRIVSNSARQGGKFVQSNTRRSKRERRDRSGGSNRRGRKVGNRCEAWSRSAPLAAGQRQSWTGNGKCVVQHRDAWKYLNYRALIFNFNQRFQSPRVSSSPCVCVWKSLTSSLQTKQSEASV